MYRSLEGHRYKITRHAFIRLKERYGEKYIENKKIKNMGIPRLKQIIIEQLRYNVIDIKELGLVDAEVTTELFKARISIAGINNTIVTILCNYRTNKIA